MKKLLALILACLLTLTAFVGCSGDGDEQESKIKGAEIQMYLTTLPESVDPAASYTSPDSVRIMGLLYEGLTKITDDGKLENALAKEWEYEIDERDGLLKLEITLENSRWSDGIIVDAEDFIYAWTRILLPENDNPNAALLYPILNAKNVKEGLCSVNDLGVYAIKDNLIQIIFEPAFGNEKDFSKSEIKENVEYFMRRLASPALVPLREDVVAQGEDWATKESSSFVTNGPFKIKTWNTGELSFERSVHYRCVGDVDSNADDKIVKPYRIITLYSEGKSATEQFERYNNKECFYLNLDSANEQTLEQISEKNIETDDILSTCVLYLDHTHELFKDARVRKALSLALDRDAIAQAVMAAPATGFIPTGAADGTGKKDFREVGGDVVSEKPNMAEAKKLIAEAGIKSKNITIEFSNLRETDKIIANACKTAWGELGFNVTVTSRPQKYMNNKEDGTYPLIQNNENKTINTASVIAVSLQSTTDDAYGILTGFSAEYGGNFIDVTTGPSAEDVVYNNHVTSFADPAYDKLCEKFIYAKTAKERSAAMHEAEEYLAEQMPVIPVVFNKANYVTQELSGYGTDNFGRLDFTELKQKNFEKYLPTEQ